jgi:hypothetical protein
MSMLTLDESRQAVRLGLARAMSEAGMTPSQAERKLAGFPLEKKAEGPLTGALDMLKKWNVAWLLGGAAAGAGAGYLHHKVDQTLAGEDDPEVAALRRKADGYHKMTADLNQTQNAIV